MAQALQNGGFETGSLPPWTATTANVTVAGSSNGVAPAEGSFQAVINTPAAGTVTQPNMETFLGLAAGTLTQYNSSGIGGGNAFKQTFDLTAGQQITFRWDFLPNGANTGFGQNDTAFFTIHLASNNSSTTVFSLSSTSASGGTPTGYQTFTTGALAAGTYLLGFGLHDQKQFLPNGNAQRPTLLIDGVAVIPEPSTVSLLGAGLLAGGIYLLRRRRS